jgi:hypothetical protein
MWYLKHDAGTVAVLAHLSATVSHVLQYMEGVVHQFVTLVAMNVDNHSYSACIVLVGLLVKPFVVPFIITICHIILVKPFFLLLCWCKIKTFCTCIKRDNDFFNL